MENGLWAHLLMVLHQFYSKRNYRMEICSPRILCFMERTFPVRSPLCIYLFNFSMVALAIQFSPDHPNSRAYQRANYLLYDDGHALLFFQ